MVKSFRGVEVDFNALSKKYEKTVALGNSHMNAKGDLLGRGGKIIKTREEQLKAYDEAKLQRQEGKVMLGDDGKEEIAEEATPITRVRKPREMKKPKQPVIIEEKKEELSEDDGFIADEVK